MSSNDAREELNQSDACADHAKVLLEEDPNPLNHKTESAQIYALLSLAAALRAWVETGISYTEEGPTP